jgi:undecaprenyl-diphosphatase
MSDIVIAVILGIVEGITEFLPISSTGHLILAETLLGFTGPRAETFALFIQLGAMAAVILYWRRFLDLLKLNPSLTSAIDAIQESPRQANSGAESATSGFLGWRALALLALTTLPAGVTGYLFGDAIKEALFNPITVAIGLAVGGVAILGIEARPPQPRTESLDALTFRQALIVGLFQCLALWPGISRSAATILGGMIGGLRHGHQRCSFLAVPALTAAGLWDLCRAAISSPPPAPVFAVGFIVSLIFAWLSIRWLIGCSSGGPCRRSAGTGWRWRR